MTIVRVVLGRFLRDLDKHPSLGARIISALGALCGALSLGAVAGLAQAQGPCSGSALGIARACLWLKADDGVLEPGGTVDIWRDQSRSDMHVAHVAGSNSPRVIAGSATTGINFNPSVRFSELDQFVGRDDSTLGESPDEVNVFFVSRTEARSTPILFTHTKTRNPRLSLHWDRLDGAIIWNYGRCGQGRDCAPNRTHARPPGGRSTPGGVAQSSDQVRVSTPFALDVPHLGLVTHNVSANKAEIVVNAKTLAHSTASPLRTNHLNTTRIGGEEGESETSAYRGQIAEFLEFKRRLSSAERTRVHSYLALKYGLTLGWTELEGRAYKNGADMPVYSHHDYWNSIVGIGRDDATGLHQRVARSTQKLAGDSVVWMVHGDALLSIATTADFTSANSARPPLTNDQYLVLGDNDGAIDRLSADALGQSGNRIARVWRAQNTGYVASVYLGFAAAALQANFPDTKTGYLLVSSDASFSTATTTSYALNRVTLNGAEVLTPVTEAGGSVLRAVPIPDGAYISLGHRPCGASAFGVSHLCIWLDAGTGAGSGAVSSWTARAGDIKTQPHKTAHAGVSKVDNALNFNPVLRYSGANGSQYLSGEFNGRPQYAPTMLSVAVPRVALGCCRSLFSTAPAGGPGLYNDGTSMGMDSAAGWRSTPVSVDQPVLIRTRQAAANTTDNGEVYKNGLLGRLSGTIQPVSSASSRFQVGGRTWDFDGRVFVGDIAEFMYYDANTLGDAKLNQIESYLALKYGLTLGTGANPVNYVGSGGGVVWTGHSTYQNRVFGIGRDSVGLDQRVSKSVATEAVLTLATTADFRSANVQHGKRRTALNAGQYLVLGDNNGAVHALTAGAMGRSANRFARVWRVQNTGTVERVYLGLDAADVTFPVSNTQPRHMFVESGADADGTFPASRSTAYLLSNTLPDFTDFWVPVASADSTTPMALTIPDGSYLSYGIHVRLPKITLTVQSRGGVGKFDFSGTNGFAPSSATTAGEMRPAALSNPAQELLNPGVAVVITQTMPGAEWSIEAVSCIDTYAATTGNPAGAVIGQLSGSRQFTILAAHVKEGTQLQCTVVNRRGSALHTISGNVFIDNGAGGGAANDGLMNGGEAAHGNVALNLSDCADTATIWDSTRTSGDGRYSLRVPHGTRADHVCVVQVAAGDYLGTRRRADVVGLNRNTVRVPYAGASVDNVHLGTVPRSRLLHDGNRVGMSGSAVDFPHRFIAGTAGALTLSLTNAQATPAVASWSEVLYRDANCNAQLEADDRLLGSSLSLAVTANQHVCVIVRQFVPAGLYEGATRQFQVQAALIWANDGTMIETLENRDHTQVSDQALRLYNEVRNVSADAALTPARSEVWSTSNSAKPGETLEYRITFTNIALEPISGLVIHSATPHHTTFVTAQCPDAMPAGMACAPPSSTVSPATAPVAGGNGTIRWVFSGDLPSAGSGAVRYRVKLDE